MSEKIETDSRGDYRWLSTGAFDLGTLIEKCPQAFLGKFIAVTSFDSGSVVLTSEEKQAGWQSKGGIAYSPKVVSTRQMRLGGFDEWYVFDAPVDLGKLWKGNVFEAPLAPGHVCDFVNFGHFGLHNPEVQELVTLFFKQLDWIRSESCVADGDLFLTFVTRNEELFFAARDALTGVSKPSSCLYASLLLCFPSCRFVPIRKKLPLTKISTRPRCAH